MTVKTKSKTSSRKAGTYKVEVTCWEADCANGDRCRMCKLESVVAQLFSMLISIVQSLPEAGTAPVRKSTRRKSK